MHTRPTCALFEHFRGLRGACVNPLVSPSESTTVPSSSTGGETSNPQAVINAVRIGWPIPGT